MLLVAHTTTSNGRMIMTIIIPPLASLSLGTGHDVLDVPLPEEPQPCLCLEKRTLR